MADFNEAVRLDPEDLIAHFDRAGFWFSRRCYDKALADFNEAIRLDPKLSKAYCDRGSVWFVTKHYEKALADYNEAIRLDPSDPIVYNNRAWLWATCPDPRLRDGKRAIESATRACELSAWKDAGRVGGLAAAYAEAGDFAKAVEWQEKANTFYADTKYRKKGEDRLKLYKEKKPIRDASW